MDRFETKLGPINLTAEQFGRLALVNEMFPFLLGVGTRKGFAFASSTRIITAQEKTNILQAMNNLSSAQLPRKIDLIDFRNHPFYKRSPQQVKDYIILNFPSLTPDESARLGDIAGALSYLIRRSDLNQ